MSRLLAITFVIVHALVGMTSWVTAYGDDLLFKITTNRSDDRVDVKVEEGKVNLTVQSPFGISQAMIERNGNNWPGILTLRLHLEGLENFKVTNGKDTLEAAVSSHDGMARIWSDGKEDSPLNSKHPYWMEIRMVSKNGKLAKTIPLKGGYFEMRLPKALFEGNPMSITLDWVDFYR